MVGDTVALGDDRLGRVVCSIDDGVYTDEHLKAHAHIWVVA
jgi:hypothetical protein